MPDTQEGLEAASEGQEDLDVNSESGFEAALAKATGEKLPEDRVIADTSTKAGLETTEEPAQTDRDEQGRFAATPETQEEQTPPPEETPEAQPVHEDPEIAAFLERYGGDPDKALKSAVEAQKLIGRQGSELGQLREQVARFEGRLDEVAKTHEQPVAGLIDNQTVEAVENMVAERGGAQVMAWAAEARPDLVDTVLDAWYVENERDARRFEARMEAAQLLQEQQANAAETKPESDPFIEELRMGHQMEGTVERVKSSMEDTDWDLIKPHLVPILADEATPDVIKNAVMSQDEKTAFDGMNALVQIARGRAITAATAKANEERQETQSEAKKKAQVASGSLRPVERGQIAAAPDEAASREEAIKAFKDALLQTETTSVREGLTYAK